MRVIKIYVEGKTDLEFLASFLYHNFDFPFTFKKNKAHCSKGNITIELTLISGDLGHGGIDASKIRSVINQIQTDDNKIGIESILIIDADTPDHKSPKGGFEHRRDYIEKLIKESDIKYFIIPDHSSDGNLENILENAISEHGRPFYNCLSNYINCINKLEHKPQHILECKNITKEKMAWYLYMMKGKNSNNEEKTDKIWNFGNAELSSIRKFFHSVLMPNSIGQLETTQSEEIK